MRRLVPLLALLACAEPEEAARVSVPVHADGEAIAAVTSDQGYEVTVEEARLSFADLVFTVAGETHTATLWDLLLPVAHAHPGHAQDGNVTGELRGRFVADFLPAAADPLGEATLIVGAYKSVNFTFTKGEEGDGLAAGDPLLGHTALLRGSARKDGRAFTFTAVIDAPEGRTLVGAPCLVDVAHHRGALGLQLRPLDPLEGDTLFDGVDFAALDADGDGAISIAPDDPAAEAAYNVLRRTLLTHDHYEVVPLD